MTYNVFGGTLNLAQSQLLILQFLLTKSAFIVIPHQAFLVAGDN